MMLAHVQIGDTPLHEAPPLTKVPPICEATPTPPKSIEEDPIAHGHPGLSVERGAWVRPLGNMELFMEIGGEYGSLNTVHALWLESQEPINSEDVREAIGVVAEKNHVLQLSVVWRAARPWFRRMEHQTVDFGVEEAEDVMDVYYSLLQMSYNMSRGPLWRARLVPLPRKASSGVHEAVLIFTLHHCITDGLTNMILSRDVLSVLNASLTGKSFDVPTRRVIPALSDTAHQTTDWWYAMRYAWKKFSSTILNNYASKLYFNGILPQPSTREAATRVLHTELSPENTRKLLQRCKEAGVTVHSCISAVAHVALLRVGQQRVKGRLDEAVINLSNCVNMRRYFHELNKDSPGCHISLEEKEFLVRASDGATRDGFWALARRVHDHLHDSLNVEHNPVKNCPVYMFLSAIMLINHELTRRARKNRTDCHIITTNMGNLKELLPRRYGDGPVEVTSLLRSVSSELTGHPCTLTFQTFDGRFMISLDYFTNKMTHDVAAQFFANIKGSIDDIVCTGAIGRQAA